MEYKISEKPYPQINYNMDYIRAANAFNNPWAGLGALLGAVLTKNYVDRGENKLADSMKDSIPTNDPQELEAQATRKMIENGIQPQSETGKQTLFDAYQKGNTNPIQPNYEVGLKQLANQSTDPLEIAALQNAINKAQPQEAESGKVTPNEINGFEKYFNENMPHMDAQGNVSNMDAAANLQAQRAQATQQGIPKFSTDEWEAKMWQEGKKQGRPDYQIQAVIDRMKPQAEAAERKYNDKMKERYLNQYYNNLPNADGTGGDPAMRLDAQIGLYKYDPDAARILGASGTPTMKDTINMNIRKGEQARDNAYKYAKLAVDLQKGNKNNFGQSINVGGKDLDLSTLSTSSKKAINSWVNKVNNGYATQEQAAKEIAKIHRQDGMSKSEIEADDYAYNLMDKIDALMDNVNNLPATLDVSPSGDMLNEITQIIDENPKLWNTLDNDDKLVINSRRYYANCMREIAAGNEEMARQYAKAIPDYIAKREGWDLSDKHISNLVTNFNGAQALKDKKAQEEKAARQIASYERYGTVLGELLD